MIFLNIKWNQTSYFFFNIYNPIIKKKTLVPSWDAPLIKCFEKCCDIFFHFWIYGTARIYEYSFLNLEI